jgi:hypothetical protein
MRSAVPSSRGETERLVTCESFSKVSSKVFSKVTPTSSELMEDVQPPQDSEPKKLFIIPLTLREANAFVIRTHRHHGPVVGHRFSVGVADCAGTLRGVAIVGRPVARNLDQQDTCEILRLATDGTKNACSKLYAAVRRIALEMSFLRCVTYTLSTESGVSLKAAGWEMTAVTKPGSWSRQNRPRTDKHPICPKLRWEAPMPARRPWINRSF